MVDASRGEFVGIEEQRRNGEAGGVGAGALIAAPGGRIDAIEIPNRDKVCGDSIVRVVGLVGFVEFAVAAVDYDADGSPPGRYCTDIRAAPSMPPPAGRGKVETMSESGR